MGIGIDEPLPDTERLLAGLGHLVARAGYERLVCAPLLPPDPRFFPDRWEPNVSGVRRLLARSMRYADLGHLGLDVTTFEALRLEERGSGQTGARERQRLEEPRPPATTRRAKRPVEPEPNA